MMHREVKAVCFFVQSVLSLFLSICAVTSCCSPLICDSVSSKSSRVMRREDSKSMCFFSYSVLPLVFCFLLLYLTFLVNLTQWREVQCRVFLCYCVLPLVFCFLFLNDIFSSSDAVERSSMPYISLLRSCFLCYCFSVSVMSLLAVPL